MCYQNIKLLCSYDSFDIKVSLRYPQKKQKLSKIHILDDNLNQRPHLNYNFKS